MRRPKLLRSFTAVITGVRIVISLGGYAKLTKIGRRQHLADARMPVGVQPQFAVAPVSGSVSKLSLRRLRLSDNACVHFSVESNSAGPAVY